MPSDEARYRAEMRAGESQVRDGDKVSSVLGPDRAGLQPDE